jgi:hypothetical protein
MRDCAWLAFTENDHWRAGIGDPTVAGWVTVAAYCVGAFFCWKAGRTSARQGQTREASFWFLFTSFLVLLGINKQLDLQTWFTLFGKHLAQDEGWYGSRRIVQAIFIGFVAVVGISCLIWFWRLARGIVRHYRVALFGAVALGCFILIRAASFHYVDRMLGLRFTWVRLNFILEVGGITCIGIAAFNTWRERARPIRQREG